jgi:hypothetical protein
VLPEIDARFRKLDSQVRLRLEQRKHLRERLEHMLIAPRPEYLATADELRAGTWIADVERGLRSAGDPASEALRVRVRRLKGLLTWNLETRYHHRLTEAHKHLRELNRDVDLLKAQYDAFVRARQAATHSYTGYDAAIEEMRGSIGTAQERLEALMVQQGQMLETVATRELGLRRERLQAQINQARFAFADSYDRAAKAQAR